MDRIDQQKRAEVKRMIESHLKTDIKQPAVGQLIDINDSMSTLAQNPSLKKPMIKWWDIPIDETWIPNEGNEINPFYKFS